MGPGALRSAFHRFAEKSGTWQLKAGSSSFRTGCKIDANRRRLTDLCSISVRESLGSFEIVSLECLTRANPNGSEVSPIWETLAFSYPIRSEPMPLDAPDHLSNLGPSTFHLAWRRPKLGQSHCISIDSPIRFQAQRMASSARVQRTSNKHGTTLLLDFSHESPVTATSRIGGLICYPHRPHRLSPPLSSQRPHQRNSFSSDRSSPYRKFR
jgi:hypothetical protein